MTQTIDEFLKENGISDLEEFVKLWQQQRIVRELLFLDRERTINKCISLVEDELRSYISHPQLIEHITEVLDQYKQEICNLYFKKVIADDTL